MFYVNIDNKLEGHFLGHKDNCEYENNVLFYKCKIILLGNGFFRATTIRKEWVL